jgi:hypothetical protein
VRSDVPISIVALCNRSYIGLVERLPVQRKGWHALSNQESAMNVMRKILIVVAAICSTSGAMAVLSHILWRISFDDLDLVLSVFVPSLPLILMAPLYKNGKIVYALVATIEAFVLFNSFFVRY